MRCATASGRTCCYYGSDCGSGEESEDCGQACDGISEYGRPAASAFLTARAGAPVLAVELAAAAGSSWRGWRGSRQTGTHRSWTDLTKRHANPPAAEGKLRGTPSDLYRSWTNRQNTRFRVSQRGRYHPTPQIPEHVSLRNQSEQQMSRTRPLGGVIQHCNI